MAVSLAVRSLCGRMRLDFSNSIFTTFSHSSNCDSHFTCNVQYQIFKEIISVAANIIVITINVITANNVRIFQSLM